MELWGFDTETHLSQPGLAAPPMVCASIAGELVVSLLSKREALAWFRVRLLESGAHLVGTNIAYDLAVCAAEDPTLLDLIFAALDRGCIHDIAIREALLDIARGELVDRGDEGVGIRYGMTLLAQRHLGLDIKESKKSPDAWRRRYAHLEHLPIEQWPWAARVYPLRDAAYPREIFLLQEGGPNLHDEPNQVRAAFALQLMSVWGMRSNPTTVAELRARVEAQDQRSTVEFQAHGILRDDGTENRKRLAELVTLAYQGDPPMTKPTARFPHGQVSSDRDTLTESGDARLENYGRAGKNDKYLTTYLPKLEQGIKQPWNPSFNVLVATTRVSSDAQQFPKAGGVRDGWVSRPGTVICSVDYGGLELRTMSQRAIWEVGYSDMAEVLNSGRDPHVIAAASFMGIPEADAVARRKAKDKVFGTFRDLGKIWNFGKGGGMGPGAMTYNARAGKNGETTTAPDGTVLVGSRFCLLLGRSERCGESKVVVKVQGKQRRICRVCLEVAKDLDAGWLKAWPEQAALFRRASQLTNGRRLVTAMIPVANIARGECGYTQWLNTPFQGLGAAGAKRAMWLVCREMYNDRSSPMWNSKLLLNVHDELISELPEAMASKAGDRKAYIMREALKEFVPDLAKSVEAEPALNTTMNKDMATVRNKAGTLLVFDRHSGTECVPACSLHQPKKAA